MTGYEDRKSTLYIPLLAVRSPGPPIITTSFVAKRDDIRFGVFGSLQGLIDQPSPRTIGAALVCGIVLARDRVVGFSVGSAHA